MILANSLFHHVLFEENHHTNNITKHKKNNENHTLTNWWLRPTLQLCGDAHGIRRYPRPSHTPHRNLARVLQSSVFHGPVSVVSDICEYECTTTLLYLFKQIRTKADSQATTVLPLCPTYQCNLNCTLPSCSTHSPTDSETLPFRYHT